jgi:hypothetical protein
MKALARAVSWLALVGTILPAVLFFGGRLELVHVKSWMLASTVAWFATAPFWMRRR